MEYKIIREGGIGEIVEKKSRFIGVTFPVSSEDEAALYIEQIKKKHYQARHNCFAFSVRNEENGSVLERFSDDGEPQGTAGLPILNVIRGAEVNNICIVVTRYFGGTLLGTGGLVRAYTDAAKAALEASNVHTVAHKAVIKLTMSYNDSGKVNFHVATVGYETEPAVFSDVVEQIVFVPYDEAESFKTKITELTSARAAVCVIRDEYR